MYLVDTHQHLWDLQRFPYSWCADIPILNRSFWIQDYKTAAVGQGIAKTIFMECDVDSPHALAEATVIDQLAETEPLIAGIVASGRPENEKFEAELEDLSRIKRLRGLRRVLHTQPDELSQSDVFRRNLGLLGKRGLTFDLCVLARQLPVGIDLVRRCPEVFFILDHCGVPDVKGHALDPWRQHIVALARLPNIACKISGLVAYADSVHWKTADLRPFVDHVIESFGWQRVLWGGDWPVCTLSSSLARWVSTTHEILAGASEEERAALLHRNAERIYRI